MRQENVRRIISVAALVILVLVFGLTSTNYFTPANMFSILRECGIVGIIAIGVTYVIITAGIDLSTGAIVGFGSMLCANLLYHTKIPAVVVMLIAILAGTLCGAINGFIVAKLRVPEFIATLSTQYLFRSMIFVVAIREGGVLTNKRIKNPTITAAGGAIGGVYWVTIAFFALAILGQIILKKTTFGTYVYATGANRKSAELSGINTEKIRMAVFTLTGFLAGIATIFEIGRIGSANTDLGTGMEVDIISAVVVGGTAMSGGRGDVFGSAIGAIFMAVLQNGILRYNLPTAAQLMIKGAVIIIMIVFDSVYNGMMQKRIQQKSREADEKLAGGEA